MRFEYEEFVSSKSGNVVRLMDLKEYVESLPKDEIHTTQDSNEYQCTCPYCMHEAYLHDKSYSGPYDKLKLYIRKDFKVGHCFRCGAAYATSSLSLRFELPKFAPELKALSVDDLNFEMKSPKYTLGLYETASDISSIMINKLYERNPYILKYKDLGFKQLDDNRLLVPFYSKEGDVMYYQIWQKGFSPKYFTPPIANKPLYITGPRYDEAVLVEGVFDAIACRTLFKERTPIAILGSTLTYAQELYLRSMFFSKIYIYLDNASLSWKLHNKIRSRFEFTDLEVIESDGTDPEEKLRYLISMKR